MTTTSQSTQFKPKPKTTMNCATCNFPHPPHELRDGRCLGCLATDVILFKADRDLWKKSERECNVAYEESRATVEELRAELARVQAQASEMRSVLDVAISWMKSGDLDAINATEISADALVDGVNILEHALSTDAGKGWASPETVKILVDALKQQQHFCELRIYLTESPNGQCSCGPCLMGAEREKALAHVKAKGLIK